jgi:CRP/FNR family cyclic AMP-dependent transcriptional regulator
MPGVPRLLDRLPPEHRRELLAHTPRRRYSRGEVIFHEGDPGESAHVLAKGHVAIRTTTHLGDVAILRVLGPGDVFGEQALLVSEAERSATAVAIDVVETHALRRAMFEQLRREDPGIDRLLVESFVLQLRRLSAHLQESLFVSSELRLLRRLVELTELFRADDGTATIPLTQADLASMAGTSRPTANQVLREAEADGLVSLSRGRISVLDLESLRSRAR